MIKTISFSLYSTLCLTAAAAIILKMPIMVPAQGVLSLEEISRSLQLTQPINRDMVSESFTGAYVSDTVLVQKISDTDRPGYLSVISSSYRSGNGPLLHLRIFIPDYNIKNLSTLKKIDFTGVISHITPLKSDYSQISVNIFLQKGTVSVE